MKKSLLIFAVAGSLLTLAACQKEPSTSDLQNDYLVYTDHDAATEFSKFNTVFVPDSILLLGNTKERVYWKDEDAREIIDAVVRNFEQCGYTRSNDRETADLGVQMSYVENVNYFIGGGPYWWWDYPYYWSPGFWGDWNGWYYPYSVVYQYASGSMLTELISLKESIVEGDKKKLKIVWDSYICGLISSSKRLNQQRTLEALDQSFAQSPYLKK